MTFLQPLILWGLLLAAVPILIHLLNRLRYRSQDWAAMRLLLSATRSSVTQAKLRQFLVLLFRVLVVVALVVFLARPLAGGWLGWMFSGAPDAVLILLDRSASMETRLAGAARTKREQALQLLSQAGRPFEGNSRLVLIESATRAPQELAGVRSLEELSLCAPTDTAADIPAMLQAALSWLLENRAGASEIWIASDLQRSNWHPDDARFKTVLTQLRALPQRVRVRLLALDQRTDANSAVAVQEVVRRQRGPAAEIQFALALQAGGAEARALPLTLSLDGAASQVEVDLAGTALRWRHRVPLGERKAGGWGSFELPADANTRDNTSYFVYGPDAPLHATVIAADGISGRFLRIAAGVAGGNLHEAAHFISPEAAAAARFDESALLVWQGTLPAGGVADRLNAFIAGGGVVIFFPPGASDPGQFNGLGWGDVQTAEAEKPFEIARWDENQGPLANTDEGLSLPVGRLEVAKRQLITGQKTTLATFGDGEAFLARQTLGKGQLYFCASLPDDGWSDLAGGPVLVPMVQRLLESGGVRLQQVASTECGPLSAGDQARQWTPLDSDAAKNVRYHAGVYRSGDRLLAVNRPAAEDEPEVLEADEARGLFAGLPFRLWQERQAGATALQREVWRLFLFAMLLFLLVEALLILPAAQKLQAPTSNIHRSAKAQAPIAAAARVLTWCFVLGASLELGAWCLGFLV